MLHYIIFSRAERLPAGGLAFGIVLEAPVPERSALVKKRASLVTYTFAHAPRNCRSIETHARGTAWPVGPAVRPACRTVSAGAARRTDARHRRDSKRTIVVVFFLIVC